MKLDAQILAKIVEQVKISVSRKLTSICQEDVQFEKISKDFNNDMIGIVSFIGDVSFILLIMLTDDHVRKISSKFVGVEMDSNSEEIGDLISEIANIVFGDIDMDLKTINLKTERSLPTILKGKDIKPVLRKKAPSIILSFGKDNILVEMIGATDDSLHKKPGS
ncbi:MAG: chemotaxis protein CheX [Nitrospinae bacterium]|nr:chemotaxis protein CheX [Nitrospinota bacterium]